MNKKEELIFQNALINKRKGKISFGENIIRMRAYLIYQRDKCDDSIRNWYLAIKELTMEYTLYNTPLNELR